MMKHIFIYIVFLFSAILIVVNRFTALYIDDYRFHFILLFLASSTFVIIIGHLFNKLKTAKSIFLTFLIVGVLCFLKGFLTWGGDWKTEKIIYRNLDNANKTINIQLRGDRFAFGYKKRIVQVQKLLPGMIWATDVDTIMLDHTKWQRTNDQVQTFGQYSD